MALMLGKHPDDWLAQIFSARAVEKGGVVGRSVAWVDHEIGRARFIEEVRLRGFHLLEAGGPYVVICRPGPIRKLV